MDLLLALDYRIISGVARVHYVVPEIEPVSPVCKAITLPAVFSLQFQIRILNSKTFLSFPDSTGLTSILKNNSPNLNAFSDHHSKLKIEICGAEEMAQSSRVHAFQCGRPNNPVLDPMWFTEHAWE